jgi:hypothetical protein
MIPPTRYRVRFNLTVANGLAMEESNGLYISIREHEALLKEDAAHLTEAHRLLMLATMRYPLTFTESQCRDAHHWLTHHAKLTPTPEGNRK